MAGNVNTTGTPNTDDYNLGRGIVYIAPLDASDGYEAWRDMGNCPEFNISIESETLEHQSSRTGLRVTDKEVEISRTLNVNFTLDELNAANLAKFFAGTVAEYANADAIAGVGPIVLTTSVELGRWYDLVDGSGNRLYDVVAGNLTLTETGTPTVLVEGTDYTVDEVMGRVFILSTATNIAAGETLDFTAAATAGADKVDRITALDQTSVKVALKFIADNPADNGAKTEYLIHKITLKADGDFALISDDWTTMGFTGAAESNAAGNTLTVSTPQNQA